MEKEAAMKIAEMTTNRIAVPLKKPFKTALRTVRTAEAVIVKLTAENGMTGWGEAPPTAVITGETLDSIEGQSTRYSHRRSQGATCE